MFLLSGISFLALLTFMISSPPCWGRSKSMIDRERDEIALMASRTKVDDLEGRGESSSPSQSKGKLFARYNRLIQRINAAPEASRKSDAASFIYTVSTNDLKQLASVQSYDKKRFHLHGQGGTFIQSLLSHKDYAKADGATKLPVNSQPQGLLAKIWLWLKAWWSPPPQNAP